MIFYHADVVTGLFGSDLFDPPSRKQGHQACRTNFSGAFRNPGLDEITVGQPPITFPNHARGRALRHQLE